MGRFQSLSASSRIARDKPRPLVETGLWAPAQQFAETPRLLPRPPRIGHQVGQPIVGMENHIIHPDGLTATRRFGVGRRQQLVDKEPIDRAVELRSRRRFFP